MTQPSLFERVKVPAYQRHSATSKAAAVAVAPKAPSLKEQVYLYLRGLGTYGATDLEGAAHFGMDGSTYRPRRIELVGEGRVVSGGTRKTPSGRTATVWFTSGEGNGL